MVRFRRCKKSWENAIALWVNQNDHITAKIVSRVFGKHINVAKEMLFEFQQLVEARKIESVRPEDLKVIYFLAGKKGNKRVCTLVSKERLPSKEAEFSTVTSKHIDSVCRKDCTTERHFAQTGVVLRYGNTQKFSAITNEHAKPQKRGLEQLIKRIEPLDDKPLPRKTPPRAAKEKCAICNSLQCRAKTLTHEDSDSVGDFVGEPEPKLRKVKAVKQIQGQRTITQMFGIK